MRIVILHKIISGVVLVVIGSALWYRCKNVFSSFFLSGGSMSDIFVLWPDFSSIDMLTYKRAPDASKNRNQTTILTKEEEDVGFQSVYRSHGQKKYRKMVEVQGRRKTSKNEKASKAEKSEKVAAKPDSGASLSLMCSDTIFLNTGAVLAVQLDLSDVDGIAPLENIIL
jgi:hypothetical protein